MTESTSAPYGPGTAAIRRFLMSLAGLGASARTDVVQRHASLARSARYIAAEALLGETIERAGRADAQEALAGPLLQLVRLPSTHASQSTDEEDALALLDPIAEPALAALLALLVADLLPTTVVETLFEPFVGAVERS